VEEFHAEHERTYGYAIRDERVELVAFKLRARGHRTNPVEVPWRHLVDTRPVARSDRSLYFGTAIGHVRTPVVGRADVYEKPQTGPLVIEEYDSTVVVPPGWSARRTSIGFIILELEQ
jgi:N-methylhydantoinase A